MCELVNCVNGLYATEMSNRDVDIDMDAPIGQDEPGILKSPNILRIPIVVCNVAIDLLLILDQDYTF